MSVDGDATRVTLPDLAGKRVLVTGASGGLGKRMAIEFARQKCKVLVHYFTRREGARDTVQRCEEAGSPFAMSFGVDLRSEAAIQTLVDCVEKDFGGVDVLVNNAGIVVKSAVEDCDSKCFDDVSRFSRNWASQRQSSQRVFYLCPFVVNRFTRLMYALHIC